RRRNSSNSRRAIMATAATTITTAKGRTATINITATAISTNIKTTRTTDDQCSHPHAEERERLGAVGKLNVDLDNLFREVVDAVAGAVAADDVVVAQPVEVAAVRIGRMDDDVHVLLDRPWLVAANERPLDKIVALTIAIEPRLFRPAVLAHEIVERLPDVLARRAGLEHIEGELARRFDELQLVLHLLRHLAEHAGATELGEHGAGPGVLDQERERVTLLDGAVLHMPLTELRGHAGRRRRAEIDAVLATVILAVVHRDRGHFGVAHAGLDCGEGRFHRAVLHDGGAANELQLLCALDDLNAVDQFAGVDITRARELFHDGVAHRERHLIGADQADGALGVWLARLGGELGIEAFRVMRRLVARRGEQALDAAPHVGRRTAVALERALTHNGHLVV